MKVSEARRLMLRHNISVQDMAYSRRPAPVAPGALRGYFNGKGSRTLPDALVRFIEEMVRDKSTSERGDKAVAAGDQPHD